jgi:uncharacterized protein (TIGR01777 family)
VATYLISGASGFIGSRLAQALAADGHRVIRLKRGSAGAQDVRWDPEAGEIDREALARVRPDVVVNLAGEPIAQRWSGDRKRRIRDSRVNGTRALATALATLPTKPSALVSGSAIGYYGAHRGDEPLDEASAPGSDYLAETARAWEDAAAPAGSAGIRVVTPRTGVVLGAQGGMLAKVLTPFRFGVGGRIASGTQWLSWISLTDTVVALRFAADSPGLSGPVNLVAPDPVRNAEFTAVLARVLHRPAIFPVPAIALRLAFGEMADATILASQRVVPKKLAGAGFHFRHPHLEDALRYELR